jgi:hypothetical protein
MLRTIVEGRHDMQIRDPEGTLIEAERIAITHSDDPWLIYDLEDGTQLRIRIVVSSVFRLNGKYTLDGDPVYVVRSQNVVAADVPDGLKKEV